MQPLIDIYRFADTEPPQLWVVAADPVTATYADTGEVVPIPSTGGIATLRDVDPIELLITIGDVTKRVTARWPAPPPKSRRRQR